MNGINADDLIALLEPGPQTTSQLAAWLQVPARDVAKQLESMRHADLVKRVGEWNLQRWALGEWEPPAAPAAKPKTAAGELPWWVRHADPTLPRASFVEAARQRDQAMQTDPTWTRRADPRLREHLNDGRD